MVSGQRSVGGLVGHDDGGFVADCYSAADVTGDRHVGGLIGWLNLSCITRCYAVGHVTGIQKTGGLVPGSYYVTRPRPRAVDVQNTNAYDHRSAVVACFWDVETSGQSFSAGGTGLTTREMCDSQTFVAAGWDFIGESDNGTDEIWWILENRDYPRLWWEAAEE